MVLLSAVGFAATCCWAAFSAVFERFFKRYEKPANAAMALLLVWCAAVMLLDLRRCALKQRLPLFCTRMAAAVEAAA